MTEIKKNRKKVYKNKTDNEWIYVKLNKGEKELILFCNECLIYFIYEIEIDTAKTSMEIVQGLKDKTTFHIIHGPKKKYLFLSHGLGDIQFLANDDMKFKYRFIESGCIQDEFIDYEFIENHDQQAFRRDCRNAISKGWYTIGGIAHCVDASGVRRYAQAFGRLSNSRDL